MFMVNVGKYKPYMDPMGIGKQSKRKYVNGVCSG